MKNKFLYLIIYLFFIKAINLQAQNDTVKVGGNTIIFSEGKTDAKKPIEVEYKEPVAKEKKEIEQPKIEITSPKQEASNIIFLEPNAKKDSTAPDVELVLPKKERYREISLNTTTLISRLVPFGNGIPLSGPTTVYFKKYNGTRAFRIGVALQASADANLKNTVLRIGMEKRKVLDKKWTFTRANDFMWAFGSFDTPGFGRNTGTQSIGLGVGYGIEYNLNKNISISTEATLFLGIGGGDTIIDFKIIPPIALYINVKLYE
jgi:hypothetical protein